MVDNSHDRSRYHEAHPFEACFACLVSQLSIYPVKERMWIIVGILCSRSDASPDATHTQHFAVAYREANIIQSFVLKSISPP